MAWARRCSPAGSIDNLHNLITDAVCREAEAVTESELSQGLASLGYTLDPSETLALMRPMDEKGVVSKSAFVASQLDWPKIQADFR